MTPDLILPGILLFFVAIQVFFYLFVFTRLLAKKIKRPAPEGCPGVSIIVCAWNERDNLEELLPLLDNQDYPEYEVLVLDDRSTDGSEEFLQEYCATSLRVRTIRVEEVYGHITPKKYAVTIGQKHARYAVTLMTDADCRPEGPRWITSMAAHLTDRRQIVLGFSPYYRKKGLLNWLIRCETFYTAVQYLSFAASGVAYMGVGRNLMYRKDLFFANRGFYGHSKVLGGDDDLFINQAATFRNVAVNIDPDSFMYSFPKTTWSEWFLQKKRHLGVGKLYRTRNQVLLGLLSGSHVWVWLMALLNLVIGVLTHDLWLLKVTAAIFGARWLLQWIILGFLNTRLGATISGWGIPLLDLALFLYYLLMGGRAVFRKNVVTQWR